MILQLNPKRIIQILHLPIKLIRIVTDPEVDFVIFIIQRLYRDFLKKHLGFIAGFTSIIIKKTLGEEKVSTCLDFANKAVSLTLCLPPYGANFLNVQYSQATEFFSGSSPITVNDTMATETIFDTFPTYLGPTEPYFALLGKEVRLGVVKFKDAWYRMAVGSGPAERVFAVGLGYAVVGLLLALYLNILTVGNARTATRAVRNAVRQQLLVIKVNQVWRSNMTLLMRAS